MQTITSQSTKQITDKSSFYAVCTAVSVVISWAIFSQFLISSDASISSFFSQAFSTSVSSLISSDIIISAIIFLSFAHIELKRLEMPASRLALYALVTCCVGICGSLSLFLYQRERWIHK